MRRCTLVTVLAAALAVLSVLWVTPAEAFDESTGTIPAPGEWAANCPTCHQWPDFQGYVGPHGHYTTTSRKCAVCHNVHGAPAGALALLPGPTITDTCLTCHDGTQGRGVYGAIAGRLGPEAVASGHSIDNTRTVPGGDAQTGGPVSMSFSGLSGTLTCSDCHSPHGTEVVDLFLGDRIRHSMQPVALPSSKLLRQRPGMAEEPVTTYGSDWCLGCHQGRGPDTVQTHSHPVDSEATTDTPFHYGHIARLASDEPTSQTVISITGFPDAEFGTWGGLGGSNRGYLMPYPRTPEQSGHAPICQQCHEDARTAGALTGDGSIGDAEPFAPSLDGVSPTGNPRFQNFPHESTNRRLLVATYDGLCLNCHPMNLVP